MRDCLQEKASSADDRLHARFKNKSRKCVKNALKKHTRNGVPVRDYKKTKNVLMETPAMKSVKRAQKNLSSFYYFLVKSDNVNQ